MAVMLREQEFTGQAKDGIKNTIMTDNLLLLDYCAIFRIFLILERKYIFANHI